MKHHCFISHNKKDKDFAEKLGNFLVLSNIDVWYDSWEVFAGDSLTDKISDAIDKSDIFIILLSKYSTSSKWVKEELRIAINRRINDDSFKIIPIKLDDEIVIPAFLRDYRYLEWNIGDAIIYENLLNSIYRITAKPIIQNEDLGHVLSVIETSVHIEFHGYRGERTIFNEVHRYKVLKKFNKLNKRLYYDGVCSFVKNEDFHVKRNTIKDGYEEIEYSTSKEFNVGDVIVVKESYEILNNFDKQNEFWVQHIESPPEDYGKLTILFDFSNSTKIETLKVFQRESLRPIEEIVKPQFLHSQIIWSKVFTKFLDTFTFRFTWAE